MKIYIITVMFLLMIPAAFPLDYTVFVKETGNALVIVNVNGTGVFNITLPEDAIQLRVKGGLYTKEGNSLQLSVGTTREASIAYQTEALTTKHNGSWQLNFMPSEPAPITVYLPDLAVVSSTEPVALIEHNGFVAIRWANPKEVMLYYTYEMPEVDEFESLPVKESTTKVRLWTVIIVVVVLCALAGFILLRKTPKKSQKQNVMKALLHNERTVVECLLQNHGAIRRNELERITKMPKSSLASSLHNLERKNLVEIDKSQTVHFVKLTRWFDEL